jgi:hypothetical protein
MLLGDELRYDVLSRSCHCFFCLGPGSVEIVLNFLCHGANGISCPLLQFLDDIVVDVAAVSLFLNLEAAQRGRSVLFSDEQKLLLKGGKKGFAKNTKLDYMRC